MENKKLKKAKFPIYSIINYFEGINYNNPEITSHMRSIFYTLVHVCQSKGGVRKFPLPIDLLSHISKVNNYKTLYKSLNYLNDLELIIYTKGKNRFTTPCFELIFNDHTTTLLREYYLAIRNSTNIPSIDSNTNNIKDSKEKESKGLKDTQNTLSDEGSVQKKIPIEVFWTLYSKETNLKAATPLWEELDFKTQLEIVAYLPKYVESTPDKKYRKNPDNFLKEEIWKNELINKDKKNEILQNKQNQRYSVRNQKYE